MAMPSRILAKARQQRSPNDNPAARVSGRNSALSSAISSEKGTTVMPAPRIICLASPRETGPSPSFAMTSARFTVLIMASRSTPSTMGASGSRFNRANSADASNTKGVRGSFTRCFRPAFGDQLVSQTDIPGEGGAHHVLKASEGLLGLLQGRPGPACADAEARHLIHPDAGTQGPPTAVAGKFIFPWGERVRHGAPLLSARKIMPRPPDAVQPAQASPWSTTGPLATSSAVVRAVALPASQALAWS